MLLRRESGADDSLLAGGRINAELDPFVAVVRGADGHIPPEASTLDQLRIGLNLVSPVQGRADVLQKARHRRGHRRRDRNGEQRVRSSLIVERIIEMEAATDEIGLESSLEFARRF